MKPVCFIGTAGWGIPKAEGADFPGTGSHLARYAARMNAAEINTSFYRPHRHATYARWASSVPEVFRFSVKLPKTITHELRLRGTEPMLDRFAGEVGGLGEKLGVLLAQLPPSLRFDPSVAETFFMALRDRAPVPVACEPRHPSWFTAEANHCLASVGVARVAADPPPAVGADEPAGWTGLAYLRLHGTPRIYYSDYDARALAGVAQRLRVLRHAECPAWCIFDNTAAFHALGNAVTLQAAMAAPDG